MPRIKSFPTDSTINDNDKLIGTDSQTGNTKNYKVGDLKDHIKSARLHIHHQNNASTTWVINHNKDTFPNIRFHYSDIRNFENTIWGHHFYAAKESWEEKKIIGNGVRSFRIECKKFEEIKKKAKITKKEITKEEAEKILKEENENNIKEQAKLAKKDGDEKNKKKTDPKKKEVKTKSKETKKTKTPASKAKKTKKVSKK